MTPAAVLALLLALSGDEGGPVVVVPPEGPGGAGAGWIGAAVAETLPRALQRAGVPAVPGIDRRRAQEALGVPGGSATRATAIRVAESLGASRLVVGSWDLQGADLTLSLRLLDARRGTLSAPLVARGPLAGLGRAVHALAWDVALAGPRPPAGTREALLGAADGVPFEALRALGEGLAGRDTASRVAGVRRALALHPPTTRPRWRCRASWWTRGASTRPARPPLACPGARPSPATRASSTGWPCSASAGTARRTFSSRSSSRSRRARPRSATGRWRGCGRGPPPRAPRPSCGRRWKRSRPRWTSRSISAGRCSSRARRMRPRSGSRARCAATRATRRGGCFSPGPCPTSGRAEEAEEQWRAAAALVPALEPMRKPDLSRRLERVLPSEPGLLLDPARSADAEASRAHAAKGESLLASGDREGAISELARAALLDPYATRPHLLLGRAHGRAGREREGPRRAAHGPVVPGRSRPAPRDRGAAALDGARGGRPPRPRGALKAPAMMVG